MAEEIIKTTVEIALSGICVYVGAAIYNWGYRNGINAREERILELEKTVKNRTEKIKELYEYISRDYCVNPFRSAHPEGPSFVSPKAMEIIKKTANTNHLKSKVKAKEMIYKGEKIK